MLAKNALELTALGWQPASSGPASQELISRCKVVRAPTAQQFTIVTGNHTYSAILLAVHEIDLIEVGVEAGVAFAGRTRLLRDFLIDCFIALSIALWNETSSGPTFLPSCSPNSRCRCLLA